MSDPSEAAMHRPVTKAARLSVIEEALLTTVITSQQQLLDVLSREGLDVTQSTLSRDLDELHAVKTRRPDGTVAYEIPEPATEGEGKHNPDKLSAKDAQQLSKILPGLIVSVASAGNIVVIHTPSGAAQYLGSVLDRAPLESVLGTIAGDDTVMMVIADERSAEAAVRWLLRLASDQRSAAAPDKA
ncbi:MAG: arginine repressor [Bifidobacteriaceae bacterium]|nr:arginine repressor [Bifidobacteriaceae bacterium]